MDFLNLDKDVVENEERDTTGGFTPFESDLYRMTVKTAYLDKSAAGSNNVVVLFEDDDGKSFKIVEYVTTSKGLNYYIDKNDGKTKRPMVGLTKMNSLSQVIKGTKLGEQVFEDKVHKIWDNSQGKELPQSRKTLTEWAGEVVHLGLKKVIENKTVKNDAWVVGMPKKEQYLPTAELRETNEVDKFFDRNKATNGERAEKAEPEFYKDWLKVHQGKTKDKSNKSIVSSSPTEGVPASDEPIKFDE